LAKIFVNLDTLQTHMPI